MDAEYLQAHVGTPLSAALAATLLQSPQDPVEFLARWLLHSLTVQKEEAARASKLALELAEDEKLQQEASRAQAVRAQQVQQQQAIQAQREAALQRVLQTRSLDALPASTSSSSSPARALVSRLYEAYFNTVAPLVPAGISMYAAAVETEAASADAESTNVERLLAAGPSDVFLLRQKLTKTDSKGVVFSLYEGDNENDEPEAEAEEEGTEEEQAEKKKKAAIAASAPLPPLKSLFIPNVRFGPKASAVHFFNAPRSGSFLAFRFCWQSVLGEASFDDALERIREREEKKRDEAEAKAKAASEADAEPSKDDVVEKEEDEDEEEEEIDEDDEDAVKAREERREERRQKKAAAAIPVVPETEEEKAARLAREAHAQAEAEHDALLKAIPKLTQRHLICFDSLASGERLDDALIGTLSTSTRALLETAIGIDRALFDQELAAYQRVSEWQANASLAGKSDDEKEAKEEAAKEQRASLKSALIASQQPATQQDVEFAFASSALLSLLDAGALDIQTACSALRGGGIEAWQAALYLLGSPLNEIGDFEARATWSNLRSALGAAFAQRVKAYQPRTDEDEARAQRVQAFLATVDVERIKERNALTAAVVEWIKAALEVRKRVRKERKQLKEKLAKEEAERIEREEEEKRKAEEEAAAAAEAEAKEGEEEENQEEAE